VGDKRVPRPRAAPHRACEPATPDTWRPAWGPLRLREAPGRVARSPRGRNRAAPPPARPPGWCGAPRERSPWRRGDLQDVPLEGAHLERGQRAPAHRAHLAAPASVVVHQVGVAPPARLVVPQLLPAAGRRGGGSGRGGKASPPDSWPSPSSSSSSAGRSNGVPGDNGTSPGPLGGQAWRLTPPPPPQPPGPPAPGGHPSCC
jgi:hypothetical protein